MPQPQHNRKSRPKQTAPALTQSNSLIFTARAVFEHDTRMWQLLRTCKPTISASEQQAGEVALARAARLQRLALAQVRPGERQSVAMVYSPSHESASQAALLTEYSLVGNLGAALSGRRPFDERAALQIAHDIAHALEVNWTCGIVHRRIQPASILLVNEPGSQQNVLRAKLDDYTLAWIDSDPGRPPIVTELTSPYSAPGLLAGRTPHIEFDLYSLCCVLLELLSAAQSVDLDHDLRCIAPNTSHHTIAILRRGLGLNMEPPFDSPSELKAALKQALQDLPQLTPPSHPSTWNKFHFALISFMTVVTVVAISLGCIIGTLVNDLLAGTNGASAPMVTSQENARTPTVVSNAGAAGMITPTQPPPAATSIAFDTPSSPPPDMATPPPPPDTATLPPPPDTATPLPTLTATGTTLFVTETAVPTIASPPSPTATTAWPSPTPIATPQPIIRLKLTAFLDTAAPRGDPSCINVRLIVSGFALNAEGWELIAEGLRVPAGKFNRGGFAAVCLNTPDQEFKFTIAAPSSYRLAGNTSIPAKGGDTFEILVERVNR